MTLSKNTSSEEAANLSDQGKSPDSLAKTKDGSMFAAKARAAELNATRARKAAAKHAHLLTDDDVDNDVPPLAPVPLGSLKFTRSRSRGSKAWKPPNNLTELPEATAENKVKSPSPQHHSLQFLQRASNISHQNLEQSTSCLDPLPLPAVSSSRSGKTPVSTDKPSVADWQTEVIFKFSPHQSQQILQHALCHTQPTLQQFTQHLTPLHVHTPPLSLQQASPKINNSQPLDSPLQAHDLDLTTFDDNPAYQWDPDLPPLGKGDLDMTPVQSNTNTSFVRRPPAAVERPAPTARGVSSTAGREQLAPITGQTTTDDVFGMPLSQYTVQDVRHSGSQAPQDTKPSSLYPGYHALSQQHDLNHRSAPNASRLTEGTQANMSPLDAKVILSKLGKLAYGELMALSDKDKLLINTAQYALGQPLTDWGSSPKTIKTHVGSRDPPAYTNPTLMTYQKSNMPSPARTVAHDPLARPPTMNNSAAATRSTLKPEAAIYTPKFTEGKGSQSFCSAAEKQHILDNEILEARYNAIVRACGWPTYPILSQHVGPPSNSTHVARNSESRPGTEAAGNIAMATFVKHRRRQTLEEAVQSLRTNSMDCVFEAMRKQIEDRTSAMTASLANDSMPDIGLSRQSIAVLQPKPIGYGRPNITETPPTTACMSNPRNEDLDKRVGSDIIANTIANLMLHENPTCGDRSIHYRNARACEVHQGPDGNKSLFDPDWGTPPSRVGRDPRRLGRSTTADGRSTYHEDPMRLRGAGSASGSAGGSIIGAFGRR